MRTYTHGVIGYLLYAKRPRHEQRLAIMGGILPDVFLALDFVALLFSILPVARGGRWRVWAREKGLCISYMPRQRGALTLVAKA